MADTDIPPKEEEKIRVFQLNDIRAEFEELEVDEDVPLYELLQSDLILYFINAEQYKSYIWTGKETSTRMKFIAANKAGEVRDKISPAIKISTVDEDEEVLSFKILVGLEEEIEYEEEQTGPAYEGKAEDEILLEELSLEKITLLLEKIGTPEGYKREMVVEGKNVYGYQEIYKEYLGEIIKERRLFPLEESVPDGSYFPENLTPRLVMSYNKVVIVDLLRKITPEEQEQQKREEMQIKLTKQGKNPFMAEEDDTASSTNDNPTKSPEY